MTLLHPALLFGLIAAGLPVVIHLLTRPKLRRIHWAAMKLLQLCLQKTKRRSRVEDLLLLILRCLLIALLVLIFARPAWLTALLGGRSAEVVTAVVLLDDSASMGQMNGTHSRFDEAKAKIDDFVSHLPTGSTCALYLASGTARGVIPKPTHDLDAFRRVLDAVTLTDRGSDLLPGLNAGVDLLKHVTGTEREIDVATDSQVSAWRDLAKIKTLCESNRKEIGFHFFVPDKKGEDNLAITKLTPTGAVAAVDQPIRCVVEVTNWSAAAADGVVVKLSADDGPSQDQGLIKHIEPGTTQSAELFVRVHEAGFHSVTATIPGDHLPADNRRSTALRVISQLRALIVEGPPTDGAPPEGFFIEHALTPVAAADLPGYYLKVTKGAASVLDRLPMDAYEIVFLSNVARLSRIEAKNLRDFVEQGGGLVVFPGAASDPSFYNTDPDLTALLPAKLQAAVVVPAAQNYLTWQSVNYQHPVTVLWNDPQAGTLSSAHFTKYFPLTPASGGSSTPQVVVNYSDGEPAVMEQAFGKGRVFLFSGPATTAWNDLPIHNAFVPLLQRIVGYATGGSSTPLNIAVGQAFTYPLDADKSAKDFLVERPGHSGERHLAGKLEAAEQTSLVRYSETDMAGVYRIFTGDNTTPDVVFATQMDPTESNLQQPPVSDVGALLQGSEPDADVSSPTQNQAVPEMIPGHELWWPLAITALLLVLFETGLAHRFSQSR